MNTTPVSDSTLDITETTTSIYLYPTSDQSTLSSSSDNTNSTPTPVPESTIDFTETTTSMYFSSLTTKNSINEQISTKINGKASVIYEETTDLIETSQTTGTTTSKYLYSMKITNSIDEQTMTLKRDQSALSSSLDNINSTLTPIPESNIDIAETTTSMYFSSLASTNNMIEQTTNVKSDSTLMIYEETTDVSTKSNDLFETSTTTFLLESTLFITNMTQETSLSQQLNTKETALSQTTVIPDKFDSTNTENNSIFTTDTPIDEATSSIEFTSSETSTIIITSTSLELLNTITSSFTIETREPITQKSDTPTDTLYLTSTQITSNAPTILKFANISALSEKQIQEVIQILENSAFDMTGCLRSCSNNGECPFDSSVNAFVCKCDPNFIGHACQTDTRPCSHVPCLNNGTCMHVNVNDTLSTSSYKCECASNFYGGHCEFKADICQNKTCSSNGYCVDGGGEPKCKCFFGFYGDSCKEVSQMQKIRNTIKLSSVLISAGSICALALLLIVCDVLSCLGLRSNQSMRLRKLRWKTPNTLYTKKTSAAKTYFKYVTK